MIRAFVFTTFLLCFLTVLVTSQPPPLGIINETSIGRTYFTGFESAAEFKGFYSTPIPHLGTSYQNITSELVFAGQFSHKAWSVGANLNALGFNHRSYPTIQLHKLAGGGFATSTMISLWVWLDSNDFVGKPGKWFSFATLSADSSDSWTRVVCINVGTEGWLHTMHTPWQGDAIRMFQNTNNLFPMKKWVHLKIYLDFDPICGWVAVWQDDVLMSVSKVRGGSGILQQAHFGLYSSPDTPITTIYNDELKIWQVPRANWTLTCGSYASNLSTHLYVLAIILFCLFP